MCNLDKEKYCIQPKYIEKIELGNHQWTLNDINTNSTGVHLGAPK